MSNSLRFRIALISTIFSLPVIARSPPIWSEGRLRSGNWVSNSTLLRDIPQYVLDYAPLVHLHSKEHFWPSDMSEHLEHVHPYINESKVDRQLTVDDLDELNSLGGLSGKTVYLESNDYISIGKDPDIEELPKWITGEHNIPVAPTDGATVQFAATIEDLPKWDEDFHIWHTVGPQPSSLPADSQPTWNERRSDEPAKVPLIGGRSRAPAVLIVVEKEEGVVDAFWFFFYSYNLGNSVFNIRFGNHVGDWEHTTMRFYKGVPKVMFLSEHEGGKGFTYEAAEKYGIRPVVYSASGTHAMYPTPGIQDYVLPFRMLVDQTDKGPLWDPALNVYSYHYNTTLASGDDRTIRSTSDPQANTLTPSSLTPDAPTSWFYYRGHWGDRYYPFSDSRQYQLGPEKHYVSGPFGPRYKALGRRTVCPHDKCVIKNTVAQRTWPLRIFIDFLFAIGIVLLMASLVIGCMSCCAFNRRRRARMSVERAGAEPRIDPEVEVTERTGLLAADELARDRTGRRDGA